VPIRTWWGIPDLKCLPVAEYMNVREQSYPSRIYRLFVEEDPHRFYCENIRRMQFEAPCFVDFDDAIVSYPSMFDWSVHRFARVLRKHLRKHGRSFHSPLLSASGNLYWAAYRTGQKHRALDGAENKFAGLAMQSDPHRLSSWLYTWSGFGRVCARRGQSGRSC